MINFFGCSFDFRNWNENKSLVTVHVMKRKYTLLVLRKCNSTIWNICTQSFESQSSRWTNTELNTQPIGKCNLTLNYTFNFYLLGSIVGTLITECHDANHWIYQTRGQRSINHNNLYISRVADGGWSAKPNILA